MKQCKNPVIRQTEYIAHTCYWECTWPEKHCKESCRIALTNKYSNYLISEHLIPGHIWTPGTRLPDIWMVIKMGIQSWIIFNGLFLTKNLNIKWPRKGHHLIPRACPELKWLLFISYGYVGLVQLRCCHFFLLILNNVQKQTGFNFNIHAKNCKRTSPQIILKLDAQNREMSENHTFKCPVFK